MSIKFKLHAPVMVKRFEVDEWTFPTHSHDHYEIIVIEKGSGTHHINGSVIKYTSESIFIIQPEDEHYFETESETQFIFIKFTDYFLNGKAGKKAPTRWSEKIESITSQFGLSPKNIPLSEKDHDFIHLLAIKIAEEYQHGLSYSEDIIADSIGLILNIIARNSYPPTADVKSKTTRNAGKIFEIISLIRKRIYSGEELKVSSLASQFNMSENYISIYFKKHTGESIKSYILKHKLYTAKYRLQKNEDTISGIAYDLGFFDESHLNRLFRKEFGVSPKEFKNQQNK